MNGVEWMWIAQPHAIADLSRSSFNKLTLPIAYAGSEQTDRYIEPYESE